MDWEEKFSDYILKRGYDYYINQKISNFTVKNNVIMATVNGMEEYEVEITMSKGIISDMYCSCPHAESGNNCKHMAAVLYKYYDNENDDNESEKQNDSITNMVNEAEEAMIKQFLINLLEEDEMLRIRFKNLVYSAISKEDIRHYKNQIDLVIKNNQDRSGFISYYNASKFYSDMMEFIDSDLRMLLDNEEYEATFDLTNYIFVSLGKIDIDDSSGEISMLASECYKIWNEITDYADIKQKRSMYQWFVNHLDGSVVDYMEDYIETILMECFIEDEFIQDKLNFTQMKVNEANNVMDSWSKGYKVGKWALRHLNLMERLGKDWNDLESYCKEYWDFTPVRKYHIEKCIENKDYQKAIVSLKESLQLDSAFAGLTKEHSTRLMEVYRLTNMKADYINQLWQLLLKDDVGNLAIFRELKEQYTFDEWLIKREIIFSELPKYGSIDILYTEEKLYDRLLSYVLSEKGLYFLNKYEDILIKKYPKEVLEKYRVEVESMANHTSNRKVYQQLVAILKTMNKITSGNEIVKEIVLGWGINYSNRKAMIDELNKFERSL